MRFLTPSDVTQNQSLLVLLYQGWPTSQMLRATTFLFTCQERAILSYTRGNDRLNIAIPFIDTHTFA